MKLRNKKTGEVIILIDHTFDNYTSLAEFTEDWEDYEEPKTDVLRVMIITLTYLIENEREEDKVDLEDNVDLEECEKMLNKLKAWKRLKEQGFKFTGWSADYDCDMAYFDVNWINSENKKYIEKDLDILFSGEDK